MKKFAKRWAELIWRRSGFALGLLGLLALLSCGLAARIELDNTLDVFFNPRTESNRLFAEWKEHFGRSSRLLLAVFTDHDLFTEENLALVSRLTERMAAAPHVRKATSLTTVNHVRGDGHDLVVEPLIQDIPTDAAALRALRARALAQPLFVKNIVSPDGRTAGILIELEPLSAADGFAEKQSVEALARILREEVPASKQPHLAGGPVAEYYYNLYMQSDLTRFMPIAFALIGACLYGFFRRIRMVALAVSTVLLSVLFTLAFLRLNGYKINNTTTIVPPVVMTIAVAHAVHFLTRALRSGRRDRRAVLRDTLVHVLPPCALTGATTFAGFLSLTLSESPAVMQTGVVAAGGVLIAFATTFTLLPALWKHVGPDPARFDSANAPERMRFSLDRALTAIGRINSAAPRRIMATAVAIGALSCWGATRLVVENSLLEQIGPDRPISRATFHIEDHLTGTSVFHLSLKAKDDQAFMRPELLDAIAETQTFLTTIPEVDKTLSIADYVRDMHRSFLGESADAAPLPETQDLVAQYALMLDPDDIEDYVDSAWRWATITVRMKEHRTERMRRVFDRTRRYLADAMPAGIEARILGEAVRNSEGADTVTRSQARSLILAMLLVFGMMFAVFRSVRVGLVSMVPNLLPLLINFGLMGFFGLWLDTATSIISAIGIGIIVDDTIHFVYGYREALQRQDGDRAAAMRQALLTRGRPIVCTSAVLAVGFAALMSSQFVPIFSFGLLSVLIMINALLADLFLLPVLLVAFGPNAAPETDATAPGAASGLSASGAWRLSRPKAGVRIPGPAATEA